MSLLLSKDRRITILFAIIIVMGVEILYFMYQVDV